jgi:hypothetical protein
VGITLVLPTLNEVPALSLRRRQLPEGIWERPMKLSL